jgi:hypothetical protein
VKQIFVFTILLGYLVVPTTSFAAEKKTEKPTLKEWVLHPIRSRDQDRRSYEDTISGISAGYGIRSFNADDQNATARDKLIPLVQAKMQSLAQGWAANGLTPEEAIWLAERRSKELGVEVHLSDFSFLGAGWGHRVREIKTEDINYESIERDYVSHLGSYVKNAEGLKGLAQGDKDAILFKVLQKFHEGLVSFSPAGLDRVVRTQATQKYGVTQNVLVSVPTEQMLSNEKYYFESNARKLWYALAERPYLVDETNWSKGVAEFAQSPRALKTLENIIGSKNQAQGAEQVQGKLKDLVRRLDDKGLSVSNNLLKIRTGKFSCNLLFSGN